MQVCSLKCFSQNKQYVGQLAYTCTWRGIFCWVSCCDCVQHWSTYMYEARRISAPPTPICTPTPYAFTRPTVLLLSRRSFICLGYSSRVVSLYPLKASDAICLKSSESRTNYTYVASVIAHTQCWQIYIGPPPLSINLFVNCALRSMCADIISLSPYFYSTSAPSMLPCVIVSCNIVSCTIGY